MKHVVVPRRMRRPATVTAVIPCYNYGRYLPSVVSSVLRQPGVDARVIIVDDASPDGSGEVARRLAHGDPRIQAVVHDENQGHIATYNDGLARVDSEFVTLLSADDLLAPGALSRAAALMQTYPDVGLVYGSIAIFAHDREKRPTRARSYYLWRIWGGDEWIGGVAGSGYNPIASPEAVVRTSVMRDVGDYNPRLPHSGDLEYWLRIAARADVGQIHGPLQAYYRVHGGNMHTRSFGTRESDLRERFAAFSVLCDDDAMAGLPTAPLRFEQARETIATQAEDLLAEEQAHGGERSHSLVAFLRSLDEARMGAPERV
ncbi:glycosyltransferase [Microbacterium sp. AZCO]|uniref:glycosyltransferase family 2 protein n=1 Tax=Microbacterium sp. AZCO TaxID=3142976 RepID=UPI0031F34CD0